MEGEQVKSASTTLRVRRRLGDPLWFPIAVVVVGGVERRLTRSVILREVITRCPAQTSQADTSSGWRGRHVVQWQIGGSATLVYRRRPPSLCAPRGFATPANHFDHDPAQLPHLTPLTLLNPPSRLPSKRVSPHHVLPARIWCVSTATGVPSFRSVRAAKRYRQSAGDSPSSSSGSRHGGRFLWSTVPG